MGNFTIATQTMRPPEPPNLMDQLLRIAQFRGLQQDQQLRQMQMQGVSQENQIRQQQITDQQAVTQAWKNWDGKDPDSLVTGVLKAGGSGNAAAQLHKSLMDLQQQKNQLDESTFAIQQKRNDRMLGRIDAAKGVADDQLALHMQGAINDSVQSGDLDPQHAQLGYQILQKNANNPQGLRDAMDLFEKSYQLQSTQFSRSQEARKTAADEMNAAARKKQADTAAQRLQDEQPGGTLYAGNVTPKDRWIQSQENYRAQLSRQATNANTVQRQGLDALQKQGDTFSQFLSSANTLKQSLAAAQSGNELASAVAPLQGTLFITTTEGVKRINQTELSGVEGAGSLVQRINGALGKQTGKGPLSDQLKQDMSKLVDLYTAAKYKTYQNQAAYTQRLHGLDPVNTPILGQDGSITYSGGQGGASAGGHPLDKFWK